MVARGRHASASDRYQWGEWEWRPVGAHFQLVGVGPGGGERSFKAASSGANASSDVGAPPFDMLLGSGGWGPLGSVAAVTKAFAMSMEYRLKAPKFFYTRGWSGDTVCHPRQRRRGGPGGTRVARLRPRNALSRPLRDFLDRSCAAVRPTTQFPATPSRGRRWLHVALPNPSPSSQPARPPPCPPARPLFPCPSLTLSPPHGMLAKPSGPLYRSTARTPFFAHGQRPPSSAPVHSKMAAAHCRSQLPRPALSQ